MTNRSHLLATGTGNNGLKILSVDEFIVVELHFQIELKALASSIICHIQANRMVVARFGKVQCIMANGLEKCADKLIPLQNECCLNLLDCPFRPLSDAFHPRRNLKHLLVVPKGAYDLQAERQAVGRPAGRQVDGGHPVE